MMDRIYRHQVLIEVPRRGLAARLGALKVFCHGRRAGQADQQPPPHDIARWCFTSPAEADAFQARFGGERVTLPAPRWDR
jgi:hypothetical protein